MGSAGEMGVYAHCAGHPYRRLPDPTCPLPNTTSPSLACVAAFSDLHAHSHPHPNTDHASAYPYAVAHAHTSGPHTYPYPAPAAHAPTGAYIYAYPHALCDDSPGTGQCAYWPWPSVSLVRTTTPGHPGSHRRQRSFGKVVANLLCRWAERVGGRMGGGNTK